MTASRIRPFARLCESVINKNDGAHLCIGVAACYVAAMKTNQRQNASITEPLLEDLVEAEKANSKIINSSPSVGSKPLPSPALYQDSGGGYNEDFTFPQE